MTTMTTIDSAELATLRRALELAEKSDALVRAELDAVKAELAEEKRGAEGWMKLAMKRPNGLAVDNVRVCIHSALSKMQAHTSAERDLRAALGFLDGNA